MTRYIGIAGKNCSKSYKSTINIFFASQLRPRLQPQPSNDGILTPPRRDSSELRQGSSGATAAFQNPNSVLPRGGRASKGRDTLHHLRKYLGKSECLGQKSVFLSHHTAMLAWATTRIGVVCKRMCRALFVLVQFPLLRWIHLPAGSFVSSVSVCPANEPCLGFRQQSVSL